MIVENEKTYRCIIEYDGTAFAGWQVQPEERTVQGVVEQAIETVTGFRLRVVAAGRTDAGVHASGQVISFTVPTDMTPGRFRKALNAVLPHDISVVEVAEAPAGFNARFDATSRTYRYTLSDRKLAVGRAYAWYPRYRLNRNLLIEATRPLSGAVNLQGFSRRNEDDDYTTVIFENDWTFSENLMIFQISAIRFFQHAVRGIVGSAVEVARGRQNLDFLDRILKTGDRALAGPTAPATGLCLTHVAYGDSTYGPVPKPRIIP